MDRDYSDYTSEDWTREANIYFQAFKVRMGIMMCEIEDYSKEEQE